MPIAIDIPLEIEQHLRAEVQNLDAVLREAAMVALFRQGKLSQHELAVALGIERLEADAVLKRHAVFDDVITIEELDDQLATLRRMIGS